MADINWNEVIAYILRLIADGLEKEKAINKTINKFGISKNELIKKIK